MFPLSVVAFGLTAVGPSGLGCLTHECRPESRDGETRDCPTIARVSGTDTPASSSSAECASGVSVPCGPPSSCPGHTGEVPVTERHAGWLLARVWDTALPSPAPHAPQGRGTLAPAFNHSLLLYFHAEQHPALAPRPADPPCRGVQDGRGHHQMPPFILPSLSKIQSRFTVGSRSAGNKWHMQGPPCALSAPRTAHGKRGDVVGYLLICHTATLVRRPQR